MQSFQVRRFSLAQLQTAAQGLYGEILELSNVDGDLSLEIAHADVGNDGYTRGHLAILSLSSFRAEQRAVGESLIIKFTDASTSHGVTSVKSLNAFHAGGLCSDWKLRVINRAPLSNVKYAQAH